MQQATVGSAVTEVPGPVPERAKLETVLAMLQEPPRFWTALVIVCGLGTLLWIVSVGYTISVGIGTWGNNIPVAWAFAIVNFVWWIGIGHAGTFISAFLLLLNQPWRAAVNRMAEEMTLIALGLGSARHRQRRAMRHRRAGRARGSGSRCARGIPP